MNKAALSWLALCAVTFAATESQAGFTVCNRRSEGLWATFSRYLSSTNKAYSECGESGRSGGCYYSSWKTIGWWRIEANQCAVVQGGSLTNRYSYLEVETDSGGRLPGASTPFYVRDAAFSWDEYTQEHRTSGECLGSSAVYDFCTPAGYWVNYKQYDTGSYSNYTLNIY